MNDGHHVDGVLLHRELHANAAKGAFQVFVSLLGILRAEVAAVRVEFAENLRHSILDKRVHIDRIDIVVVDELQQVAHLACAGVDDADAAAREVVGVEGADEDAHNRANSNEEGRETVLVV